MATNGKSNNTIGILSAVAAAISFSINDVLIKFLSGDYALHQVVLTRATIALTLLMALMFVSRQGAQFIKTKRLGAHLLRGSFVVFANFCFFLGLAALPLAEVSAIFFVSPMIITAFSVLILGEHVGPRRWLAVLVGLLGVTIVMRPGVGFQVAYLLPLAAAFGYAMLHIITRRIGGTESPATMTFYIQLVFIVVSAVIGLAVGDGRLAGQAHPSLEFLFRQWVWPATSDYPIFLLLGVASMGGGYFISQAYALCEAGLAAPFEYIALPLAIFWGVTVFGEWPDVFTWAGVALILAGGIYMFWRETISTNPKFMGEIQGRD